MKASQHYARFSDIEKYMPKPEVKRMKSPTFLKNKQKSSDVPLFDATNLDNRARMSHSRWNQSTIKPNQNITEDS